MRFRFAYFGYSVEFSSALRAIPALRAEANRLVLAEFGPAPALAYVAPGLPFPDFVPALVWEDGGWAAY